MSQSRELKNKALVLEAFDTLFNKRDYAAAERFWSSNYIQHSAHIEPGREGLFNLIKASPATLKYEPGLIVADGVRIADGVLAEHWDVLQDEATRAESKSGLPMFGESFTD
jgi:predicted SnoaL-like aldol condensation-catalyzing enzyme